MTRKIALCLMASGWIVGFIIGGIPLIWNKWEYAQGCEFDQIFYPWYMVGVITPVFSMVWLTMSFVYCRIWREASKQVKQLRVTGQQEGTSDWKSVQMVLLILGCFTICWLPYFIVACSQIYKITENSSVVAYMAAFTLAMSNSFLNPIIYAWKNSNFRQAFINLLKCKSPDTLEPSQSMRSNLHRKSSSAQHQDTLSGAFPNYSTPPFMKKIEPINAMGITFEEDEDKISAYESSSQSTSNTAKPKQLSTTNPAAVTIKIESDTTKNSIIISTTTLPSLQQDIDDDNRSHPIITSTSSSLPSSSHLPSPPSLEIKQQISLEQNSTSLPQQKHQTIGIDNGTMKTGNLIVNKLIENYGYDNKDIVDDEGIMRKYKENFLNVNDCSIVTVMNESSKRKSKSANSIIVTKQPNKSQSHGSIYNHDVCKSNIAVDSNSVRAEKTSQSNKNLFPTFNFGRKYISKSFNSAVDGLNNKHQQHSNSTEKFYPKSTELNFPA
ncbi:hypothetical protein PVAND_012130 [Polypedilum vanderplanki]|nr:hypothetical protein PVAND_012130 [Polypedilum vanderplanki]